MNNPYLQYIFNQQLVHNCFAYYIRIHYNVPKGGVDMFFPGAHDYSNAHVIDTILSHISQPSSALNV